MSEPEAEEFYRFDEPPVLTNYEMPDYPIVAKENNLEGTVTVKVTVGEDGTVEDVTVLDSSDPIFEDPALEAATLCQFKPAKLEGKPTKSRVAIPYQFRLEG